MRKDASLAEDLAAGLGIRLPAVAAAVGVLDEALRDGLGGADIASVISVLNPAT
jgi:3-hydroxyisobutyrate dehydrogenase-like beta-hydroxyacid dehydrogenase